MNRLDSDILTAAIVGTGATGGVLLAFEDAPGGGFRVQGVWQGTDEHILLTFSQFASLLADRGFDLETLIRVIEAALRLKAQRQHEEVAGHA